MLRFLWKTEMGEKLNLYTGEQSKFHTIAVADNQGNFLVCDYYSGSVYLVSDDGKSEKQLLKRDDGLYYAGGIHFDKFINLLLLAAKWDKDATLYEMRFN